MEKENKTLRYLLNLNIQFIKTSHSIIIQFKCEPTDHKDIMKLVISDVYLINIFVRIYQKFSK
jgi:hypothetical protein